MSHPLLTIILSLACIHAAIAQGSYVQYVDTRIGTANSQTREAGMFGKGSEELGQTLPAVLVPNGMNFLTPQTRDTERKCIAPYYYGDSLLQGFRCSHWIVGGCTQDYGSFTIMPMMDSLRCDAQARAIAFSHDQEIATPYLYAVELPDEGISAEMTGSERAGIWRFVFDKPGTAYILIQPNSDEAVGTAVIDPKSATACGNNPVHRIYQGKGQPAGFAGHYAVEFSKPVKSAGSFLDGKPLPGTLAVANGPNLGSYAAFDIQAGDTLLVKAACSFTGHGGAVNNLSAEIPGWDFDAVAADLKNQWEKRLGTIAVESDDLDALEKFYTALYHASFLPHRVNDADGSYSPFSVGYPLAKLQGDEKGYYDDYSMWDSYRALHPLYCLLFPSQAGDMMQSLVRKYEQGGWMPIFPCWNSYTAAMIGDHCASVIADAYCKGIRNFDAETAYEGLRKNAFEIPSPAEYANGMGRRALDSYLTYGYIPVEDSVPMAYHKREQTSRTLEYAYDDFALSTLAKALGHDADYAILADRAKNYINVINPATGYADGRHISGEWTGDNPVAFSKHITEGAPCHYTWYVPHDPSGLMEAMGGKKAYVERLDSMFSERRYWHGNEPCHQVAYMYNYAGQPWKTAKAVRHIMDTEYLNCPGGLSGNDDAGQMSAWYVFAALGFYPVCPGTPYYEVSGPTFKSATIKLENGKTLTILPGKDSGKNKRGISIKHNGKPYHHNYLIHDDLMQGGVFIISPLASE